MTDKARQLSLLSDISDNYMGILSDVWGVVHNGIEAHKDAVEALVAYRRRGGRVVLITNASRTAPFIGHMLDEMNITREAYDAIVTSGDVTRTFVAEYADGIIHHVGPQMDDVVFAGMTVKKGTAKQAAAVVVTGLDDDSETPDDYQEALSEWLELGLPMICTNPDKIVEIGERMVWCAGALADIYEDMGGKVLMAGKPNPPIYNAAFEAFEKSAGAEIPNDKILAIGDSVRTDANGAAKANIDLLFITGSIHADEIDAFGNPDPKKIAELIAPSGARLAGFQTRLK